MEERLKRLALSYAIIMLGQLLSMYFAIITIKTDYFSDVSIEKFSFFIEKPLGKYIVILLLWNLFTGFIIAIIIMPLIKFFRDDIPKFIWLLVLLGQLFLLKDAQLEKLVSFEFFTITVQLIPAFISLFIAIYFQSRPVN